MMEHNPEDRQGEGEDQVGPLMELLRDSSKDPGGPYVPGRGEFAPRWKALAGLLKLGAAAVVPLCQALQDQNGYTRRFAAEALGKIGDARAVVPLVIALQQSEVYVQRYVAGALAALGDARAVEPLCTALRHPDVAREALLALHAVLERAAGNVSIDDLRLVASLEDDGRYVVEVPDTDGGYLSWERVEYQQDCRPVKQLAQQELGRRGLVG
jgi:HEAT repeat protein